MCGRTIAAMPGASRILNRPSLLVRTCRHSATPSPASVPQRTLARAVARPVATRSMLPSRAPARLYLFVMCPLIFLLLPPFAGLLLDLRR